MATLWLPNPDGEDFEEGGKFFKWRRWLQEIRQDFTLSEEMKLRWITHLKEKIFPFWHRLAGLREREGEELMAVYLKYNGPDGILKRYAQEYDEIRAEIAASDDADLFQDMMDRNQDVCNTRTEHDCGPIGSIHYNFRPESLLGYIDHRAIPRPAINIVPLAEVEGIPHHHNMNPDDDPSLKGPLLRILYRLMEDKDGEPFIDDVDDIQFPEYYRTIQRPRCLKFIERGLKSEDSVGYGATAFLTDMSLIFSNYRICHLPKSKDLECADNLEKLLKALLGEMGDVGEKLLAQYDAILSLGQEDWTDPERYYLIAPYNPRLHDYVQRPGPKIESLRRLARIQFEKGQERVQQLRGLLASGPSSKGHDAAETPVEGEALVDSESRKRARDEDADTSGDELDRGPKRRRFLNSSTPGPSNLGPGSPHRAAAKRIRASIDDDADDDAEADKSHELRGSKRQRLTGDKALLGVPSSSSGAAGSRSYTATPAPATPKRNRAQVDDDDSEGDDVDDGDGHGPSDSKRRRVMKDAPPTSLAVASTQAGPSTPSQATRVPGGPEPGSAQSHLTSPAGQPTPQPAQYPSHYGLPSSAPLKFSRNTITMSKIAKIGKRRPWLFGYKTAEGYGIYAFVSCPGANCKHHFTSHPLREHRARDHILACNQPIRDDRDMIRQYARQVVKDADRKSDLTVDWARKSNLSLLPSNLKGNHPENFPISSDDEQAQ